MELSICYPWRSPFGWYCPGIYLLPILTAPSSPDQTSLKAAATDASFTASLSRDLKGSDFLHWGEGSISLSPEQITHIGALAPGPDYRLYLTPSFAQDEAEFLAIKSQSVQIAPVNMFSGMILDVPAGVDINKYNSLVIWCEAFGEFITAAQYR